MFACSAASEASDFGTHHFLPVTAPDGGFATGASVGGLPPGALAGPCALNKRSKSTVQIDSTFLEPRLRVVFCLHFFDTEKTREFL